MTSQINFHGSDIELISQHYGIDLHQILNFSGNVNPLGIPSTVTNALINHLEVMGSYPERDYAHLLESISLYTHTPISNIVLGNGSTELISKFIQWVHPKVATIISPTYSEYKSELNKLGAYIDSYVLSPDNHFELDCDTFIKQIHPQTQLIIICNPNNPTSSFLDIHQLNQILTFAKANQIFLMIDETYIEFLTLDIQLSACALIQTYPNLFVIRGISKFYGLPGLRLGYGLTSNPDILKHFSDDSNPWTINSVADYCGRFIFTDKQFMRESVQLITSEIKKIQDFFQNFNQLKLFPIHSNFFIVEILSSEWTSDLLFEHLIQKKMMIRSMTHYDGLGNKYFRFCVLDPNSNKLLLEELGSIFS